MWAVAGDDGKLQIAIEGRGRDRLPHATFVAPLARASLDLNQPRMLRRASCHLIQVKAWQEL